MPEAAVKYYIKRDLNEYGPYTLADIQRYVAQGNISTADLTRSEGLPDWVPVSQVIGNIPIPVPAPAAYAGAIVYGAQSAYGTAPAMASPVPPDFHWALVLLISIVTCGIFYVVWFIVEAAWIRKIKPLSRGLFFVGLGVGCSFSSGFIDGFVRSLNHGQGTPISGLLSLGGLVLQVVGAFGLRSDLEDYYTTTENINLDLSGVGSALLTFFFPVFYFQYHFSRIAKWKKTGVLEPQ